MRLSDWLSRLDERLDKIELAQARNTSSLEVHMRRSDALEESLSVLRAEVRPLSTHVAVVGGVAKVFGGLAVLAGMALAVAQLMGWR